MKKFNRFLSLTFLAILLSMSVSVMGQGPLTVDVIQPDNSGIVWVIGETYTISWMDNLTNGVNIWLWDPNKSGGAGYQTSALATNVSGSTWTWDMSLYTALTPGTEYHIKVESYTSPTAYSNIGADFALVYELGHAINIVQPDVANISWKRGTTHIISWEDSDYIESVNIYLENSAIAIPGGTNTGGTNWEKLLTSSAVTGTTWEWDIAANLTEDANYKIRVQSNTSSTVLDRSANTFWITETSGVFNEIYQPTSATIWAISTDHLISWRDEIEEPVYLYYSSDGGTNYTQIGTTSFVGSTYVWTTPVNASATARIKIVSSDDDAIFIESDVFTISDVVGSVSAIYQPLTTASWTLGTKHLISWLDNLEGTVNVFYSIYTGSWSAWTAVIGGSNVTGATCVWDIPTGLTTGNNVCKIRVESSIDNTVGLDSDPFDLTLTTGTFVDVIQPSVGGIVWARNTSHYLSWDDDLLAGENVDISLCKYTNSTDAIGTETSTVSLFTDVVGSTKVWPIGTTAAGYYRIKVFSHDDPSTALTDYSTSTFTISTSVGNFITVNSPNGGENWLNTTTHWIAWDDDCVNENFDIILYEYTSAGADVANYPLATDIGPGSAWEWTIAQLPITSTNKFKIVVKSTLGPLPTDISNGFFYINPFGKSVTSIGDIAGDIAASVVIYPNPTSGQFSVSAPGNITKVEVRNLLGQVLYSGVETTIDVVSYDAGLYIVNIEVEGQVIAKKLFIQ
ncbi:MAG: T9SS type A sorting domain-containing protein [Bacteroidetes bacterium]|nr:T9SS type A sorting domain-containing protein [Bacteroidota bacterium]